MSTPSNTAKLGTIHSNIQTVQSCPSLDRSELTMQLVSTLLSQRINPLCQPGICSCDVLVLIYLLKRTSSELLRINYSLAS